MVTVPASGGPISDERLAQIRTRVLSYREVELLDALDHCRAVLTQHEAVVEAARWSGAATDAEWHRNLNEKLAALEGTQE